MGLQTASHLLTPSDELIKEVLSSARLCQGGADVDTRSSFFLSFSFLLGHQSCIRPWRQAPGCHGDASSTASSAGISISTSAATFMQTMSVHLVPVQIRLRRQHDYGIIIHSPAFNLQRRDELKPHDCPTLHYVLHTWFLIISSMMWKLTSEILLYYYLYLLLSLYYYV